MDITRTWAESHKNVALFDESMVPEGFKDMVSFINATLIRYELTMNPTIYMSYIIQFWHTAIVKTKNGDNQIKAKVDGQQVLVTESSKRETLLFDDDAGIKCLVDTAIFDGLKYMI